MKFKTIEDLISAWRQADDGKRYHLLLRDDDGVVVLSRFDQWSPDRRRWPPKQMSMAEAALKVFMDLGRDRYEIMPDGLQRKRVKNLSDVEGELARYELEEVKQ